MPLLKLETTAALSEDKRKELLAALSHIVSATVGKPEKYVMVTVGHADMLMSGTDTDMAFVDIRSIGGLNLDVNGKLSRQICELLEESLGITPDRVYLNFTDIKAANWGWDGNTFG
jgi:phenylpyruvate tautomerase PptA (4-oxalocrotonate tautomerase family)